MQVHPGLYRNELHALRRLAALVWVDPKVIDHWWFPIPPPVLEWPYAILKMVSLQMMRTCLNTWVPSQSLKGRVPFEACPIDRDFHVLHLLLPLSQEEAIIDLEEWGIALPAWIVSASMLGSFGRGCSFAPASGRGACGVTFRAYLMIWDLCPLDDSPSVMAFTPRFFCFGYHCL